MAEEKQLELDLGDAPAQKPRKPVRRTTGTRKRKPTGKSPSKERAKNLVRQKQAMHGDGKRYRMQPVHPASLKARKEVVIPELGRRKGYRNPISRILLVVSIVLGLMFCLLGVLLFLQTTKRRAAESSVAPVFASVDDEKVTVTIRSGMSAREVAVLLESQGVIASADRFITYLVSHDLASRLSKGTYLFDRNASDEAIANILSGVNGTFQVSVSPGMTIRQIDTYLSQRGYARQGEFIAATDALVSSEGLSFSEGWFFPGSYPIRKNDAASSLAVAMHQKLLDELSPLSGSEVARTYGLEAVLIIATMVQAETQNGEEMPLIAGIIYNRLAQGIPLGIDATTRYETGDWTHAIAQEVFERQTPYNTRRKAGLPPSGICCPGSSALEAAFAPGKTDALFYLHGKDGKIHTAKDYQGHQQNIEKYM
jgi:UPF0755 protein